QAPERDAIARVPTGVSTRLPRVLTLPGRRGWRTVRGGHGARPVEITSRRRRMLKHVVEEYVRSATPVSSEVIVRRYEPSVSSATVRNELSQLEELGLISHPHTSAGRVPTDVGYRFFVEHLMERGGP